MFSELHSIFSPLRKAPSNGTPSRQKLLQDHVSNFLLCDSSEESDSTNQSQGLVQGNPHRGMSYATGTASPGIAAEIKTACSAAARHPKSSKSGTMTSYRVAHVYEEASVGRSLHLRTASQDGDIITDSFGWNSNDPYARSADCGIPRPDSPTMGEDCGCCSCIARSSYDGQASRYP
ncbi:hypothetical protein CABS01_16544 [Colletotrichum abscissum]|uniref:uncharacterized protein n=1 Tax=Colletotrichum abscissum TaxID=1671311 RepID=UPI0027D5E923|nr:uncharacterized protein CABS01_16544 [Colletotrichum abscissum]KAK1521568.1 hypothetical protein CABS01_16544 [Colletotrichum abscissum]